MVGIEISNNRQKYYLYIEKGFYQFLLKNNKKSRRYIVFNGDPCTRSFLIVAKKSLDLMIWEKKQKRFFIR